MKRIEFLENISLENEIWKEVNYVEIRTKEEVKEEEVYASNHGRFISFRTTNPKLLTPQIQNAGYSTIKVAGKWRTTHRIIAHLFLEPIEGKNEVDHIDKNKQNNNVKNLRWVTRGENMKGKNKRTLDEIIRDGRTGNTVQDNHNTSTKKVYLFNLSGIEITNFSSINVAAKETLGNWQRINECISGKKLIYRGAIWLDDRNKIWDRLDMIKESFNNRSVGYNMNKMIQMDPINKDGSSKLF